MTNVISTNTDISALVSVVVSVNNFYIRIAVKFLKPVSVSVAVKLLKPVTVSVLGYMAHLSVGLDQCGKFLHFKHEIDMENVQKYLNL